jgi:hypothetical protein
LVEERAFRPALSRYQETGLQPQKSRSTHRSISLAPNHNVPGPAIPMQHPPHFANNLFRALLGNPKRACSSPDGGRTAVVDSDRAVHESIIFRSTSRGDPLVTDMQTMIATARVPRRLRSVRIHLPRPHHLHPMRLPIHGLAHADSVREERSKNCFSRECSNNQSGCPATLVPCNSIRPML